MTVLCRLIGHKPTEFWDCEGKEERWIGCICKRPFCAEELTGGAKRT